MLKKKITNILLFLGNIFFEMVLIFLVTIFFSFIVYVYFLYTDIFDFWTGPFYDIAAHIILACSDLWWHIKNIHVHTALSFLEILWEFIFLVLRDTFLFSCCGICSISFIFLMLVVEMMEMLYDIFIVFINKDILFLGKINYFIFYLIFPFLENFMEYYTWLNKDTFCIFYFILYVTMLYSRLWESERRHYY